MKIASKYQHTAHVNNKLVFCDDTFGVLLILWIYRNVSTAGDFKIHDRAIWRIGFSFQLPLADCLPCVIYVNYIDMKNFVKMLF